MRVVGLSCLLVGALGLSAVGCEDGEAQGLSQAAAGAPSGSAGQAATGGAAQGGAGQAGASQAEGGKAQGGSGGKAQAAGQGGQAGAKLAATRAIYGKASETELTPYPSNRYTKADPTSKTGLRVEVTPQTTGDAQLFAFAETIDQINSLDGFSTVGGGYTEFTGPLDPKSVLLPDGQLSAEAPVYIVDVDPTSPEKGRVFGIINRYYEDFADDGARDQFVLLSQPSSPLRPRTRYLYVVTDKVRDQAGKPVGPEPSMTELLTGDGEGDYGKALREALPTFSDKTGVELSRVAMASLFVTRSVVEETFAMGKAHRAKAPPAEAQPFTVDPTHNEGDRVRFAAKFKAPEYRRPRPSGKWVVEAEGEAPVAQKEVDLELFADFSNAKAPGPRPVVIYGHGLSGDKDGTWGTAGRLSELGVVVFGIDAPEHGSRSDPPYSDDPAVSTFAFFGVDGATKTFDIEKARDNFRQMASDQLELLRFIKTLGSLDVLPVGAPDGVPDIDPSRILYIGHSFGSVLGAQLFALAPEIEAACFNVGGDGLMTLVRESGLFKLLVSAFRPKGTTDGDVARFFVISQAIVDPGDPLNYARYAALEPAPFDGWKPRNVLLQEAFKDGIVPNITSRLLARASGMAHVGAIVDPVEGIAPLAAPASGNVGGATLGFSQFHIIDGKAIDHGSLIFTEPARKQYATFFKTALEGKAVVIDPFAP